MTQSGGSSTANIGLVPIQKRQPSTVANGPFALVENHGVRKITCVRGADTPRRCYADRPVTPSRIAIAADMEGHPPAPCIGRVRRIESAQGPLHAGRRAIAVMDETNTSRTRLLPDAVRIGGLTKLELLRALREQGVRMNRAAEVLFGDPRFVTLDAPRVVEIAARSVAELGFAEGATYERLVARARESGLTECPLETGPHLRLQFQSQSDSSDGMPLTHGRAPAGSIVVASPPLDDASETPKGFYLRRVEGVSWLRGYWSSSVHVCSPQDVLAFARRIAD
jgi:hypothetical protein